MPALVNVPITVGRLVLPCGRNMKTARTSTTSIARTPSITQALELDSGYGALIFYSTARR
jgi:hypothetical protein